MSGELRDNVVSIENKKELSKKRPDVIRQAAEHSSAWLKSRLQALFESVDDALFDLAERAENNNVQTQYFDGMRELRKKRRLVEQQIQAEFDQAFQRFRNGMALFSDQTAGDQESDEDSLSLVDDSELEESLAITSMIAKGENKFSKSLFAINHRFGIANACPPPADDQSPVGPACLCQCFRVSLDAVQAEISVMLILYKLYDKLVISHLGDLYDELNSYMIEQKILPRIKHSRFRSNASESGSMPDERADPESDPEHELEPEEAALSGEPSSDGPSVQSEPRSGGFRLFESIQGLLANRRKRRDPAPDSEAGQHAGGTSGSTGAPSSSSNGQQHVASAPAVDTNQMLNALTMLQAEAISRLTSQQDGSSREAVHAMDDTPVKSAMIEQIKALSGLDQPGSLPGEEEDAIDLVAMLFEYIQEDRNLPDSMQMLIGRLQIPYIKVALLDQHLFAKSEHPARQLLNRIADAGVGWSDEADPGRKLYTKIADIVDNVIRDFDDDIHLFEQLLLDFDAFETKRHKRVAVAEKRATEAAKGHERLQQARSKAAEAVSERIDGCELPLLVDELIRKPLANAMVLQWLRNGEQGYEWIRSLSLVEDLIWSVQPKESSADVARLQSTLPHISQHLRSCLESVAYQESDIKAVFSDMKTLYKTLISEKYHKRLTIPEGVSEESREAIMTLALPETVQHHKHEDMLEVAEKIRAESGDQTLDINDVFMTQINELKIGTWFTFRQPESDQLIRAKLSWKSPITSKFLFVNQKGLKVADKSIVELAESIKSGHAQVLDNVPLFDRALQQIMTTLSDDSEDSADEGPPADPSSPAAPDEATEPSPPDAG